MKNMPRLLMLLSAISLVPNIAFAQDPCSYCGTWIPYAGVHELGYISSDRLIINDETLALPGCSSARYTQVYLTNEYGPGSDKTYDKEKLKAILAIEKPIKCALPVPVPSKGALLEINLRQGPFARDVECLSLTIFSPTTVEEIKASYTYQLIPTPPGQKQMIKRPRRPQEVARWACIREGYDPCEEGTAGGTLICASIKYKKADEELNADWKRLLGVIPQKDRRALVSTQRKWLKALEAKCSKERAESGSMWAPANETLCLAFDKSSRSQEFRDLYDCIRDGNLNCPKLKRKP